MNENIEFLQAFLKNPLKVGSIAPSSPELAQQMVAGIRPNSDAVVLELGVGTGAITKFLQDIVPNRESYLGIEIDRTLVKSLKENFPALKIVRGNACDAHSIHQKTGFGRVGYIICCLPFVSLPNETGEKVLAEIDKFMEQGLRVPHVSIRARLLFSVGDKTARTYAPALRQSQARLASSQKRAASLHADLENRLKRKG
jgi:phospholipid N-methyltransferase